MGKLTELASGWRAVCLVAIAYVYFLIFAQFAFLHRLDQLGVAQEHLATVMAAMAAGGIVVSLLLAFRPTSVSPQFQLQMALLLCGATAALTLGPLGLASSMGVSLLIGLGLGWLTVTLVSNLRLWIGRGDGLIKVGLGTGIGYFICNLPPLFTATPAIQSMTAASLCAAGIFVASRTTPGTGEHSPPRPSSMPFAGVVLSFTALVWLDSAAFYIIQNTSSLKSGTWGGATHLWVNGALHLGAALLACLLLRRYGLSFVLGLSVAAFAVACLLLDQPGKIFLASLFYPVAVSLYSVALVAYPSLLLDSGPAHRRAFRAGWIYAVAGWGGSAMGIGMGQHLGRVPLPFVAVAALLVLAPLLATLLRRHALETALIAAGLAAAFCVRAATWALQRQTATLSSPVDRGRRVYIAEGCIHCHSQYVRPGTADSLMWGPAETVEELHAQRPPLIGNRRQGPDLSQVGGRRSPLWLKAHLFSPREVSPTSFMPSYRFLFADSTRGDDLVEYLASLQSPAYPKHIAMEQGWQPSESSLAAANPDEGAHLYGVYCASCHEPWGSARAEWRTQFKRLPPNLHTGPWLHIHASDTSRERVLRLARMVKFGIAGTDMPGHEYLPDHDIASMALWLNRTMSLPQQVVSTYNKSGDDR